MNIEQKPKHDTRLLLHGLKPGTVYRYMDPKQVHQQSLYLMLEHDCVYFEKLHRTGKQMVLDLKTDKICQHDGLLKVVALKYVLQIEEKD